MKKENQSQENALSGDESQWKSASCARIVMKLVVLAIMAIAVALSIMEIFANNSDSTPTFISIKHKISTFWNTLPTDVTFNRDSLSYSTSLITSNINTGGLQGQKTSQESSSTSQFSNHDAEFSRLATMENVADTIAGHPKNTYHFQNITLPHMRLKSYTAAGSSLGDHPPKHANATLFTLCRNSDLYEMLQTIQNVEDRFNRNFHYDWVFLNDKPFTSEFIVKVSNLVSGNVFFDLIPSKYWSYPEHIDLDYAAYLREQLAAIGVKYGNSESYRHMCRFQSGFFYNTSFMQNYKYYWRLEPGIRLNCDINYDVFKYMEENKKDYGFVISIFEYKETIFGLWDIVKEWLLSPVEGEARPNNINELLLERLQSPAPRFNLESIDPNSLLEFLIGSPHVNIFNDSNTSFKDLFHPSNFHKLVSIIENSEYNLCHYWNNFEIANMDVFRSETYQSFFKHIDQTGGFFYSRFGDAVVHSIAVSLFLSRDQVHWFNDIAYLHAPYETCPLNDELFLKNKCACSQIFDFTFDDYSCTGFWLSLMGKLEDQLHYYKMKQLEFGKQFVLQKYNLYKEKYG